MPPYGFERSAAGVLGAGPEEFKVPFNQIQFRNALGNSVMLGTVASGLWTNTGSTTGVSNCSGSPIGNPYTFLVTDTSGTGTGSTQGAPATAVAPNRPTNHSVYVRIGSGSGTCRLVATRTGGTGNYTVSVDVAVASGILVNSSVPVDCSFTLEVFQVNVDSWFRICILIDDKNANTLANWQFFPDFGGGGVAKTADIQGCQIATTQTNTQTVPLDKFQKVPYFPTFPRVNDDADMQPGTIPRYNIDTRIMGMNSGSGAAAFKVKMPEWHGSTYRFNINETPTVTLPASSDTTLDNPLLEGYYFYLDVTELMKSTGTVPTLNLDGANWVFIGLGSATASGGTTQNILADLSGAGSPNAYGTRAVCSMLMFLYVGNNVWHIYPIGNGHGAVLFTASGNFFWPQGVQTVYLTGAGSGGGGGGGSATAGGGGGGSGQAQAKVPLVTGAPGTIVVTINAAGAGGAAAAVGTVGGTVTFGALLTLAGGLGGAAGGGAGGVGGAAGGAGANPGESGITLKSGAGGYNIAGGIGGVMTNVAAAGTVGANGGGGGGGPATLAGGAGGAGFLLVEW